MLREELKVSGAVTSMDKENLVMVTETDEDRELFDEEEESVLVPTTATAVIIGAEITNTVPEGLNYGTSRRPHCIIGDAEHTVGEQTPDTLNHFFSVSGNNCTTRYASQQTKKVSPEEPRNTETPDFSSETLSSLSLGDELDVNPIPENNTVETETSDTIDKSERSTHKRKLSKDEIIQGKEIRKKARIVCPSAHCPKEYDYIMGIIHNQFLPKIPLLKFFGVEFKASYKLELLNESDLPKLVDAFLKSGVEVGPEPNETNENCVLGNVNISCCDHTEKAEIEITEENGEQFSIVSPVVISSDESSTNKGQSDSEGIDKVITDTENNVANRNEAALTNKDRKISTDIQIVETTANKKSSQSTKNIKRYKIDKERFNITNTQYSDVSENEEETNTPIVNIYTKKQTGNIDGFHVDKPSPWFHHQEGNYNSQAKGNSVCNPKKRKHSSKMLCKKRRNKVRPSVCADVPPEIDKSTATKPVSGNCIDDARPTLQEVQGPLFDENQRRLIVCAVNNYLFHLENRSAKPSVTNENNEADMAKLPKFSDIEPQRTINEQNSPIRQNADHEEVKQKLNKKIVSKMQLEGKFVLEEHSDVLRIDEQIKTEVPDLDFDRAPAIEEDPDATLWYGFDGPGGRIV